MKYRPFPGKHTTYATLQIDIKTLNVNNNNQH